MFAIGRSSRLVRSFAVPVAWAGLAALGSLGVAPLAAAEPCPGRGTELVRPIWSDGGATILGAVEVDCRAVAIQAFDGDTAKPIWAVRFDQLASAAGDPAISTVDELFATDTRRFVVGRADGGLFAIDRRELTLRRLTPAGATIERATASPDGLRVAWLRSGLLHRFDLSAGVETPVVTRDGVGLRPVDAVHDLAWAPSGFGLALLAEHDGRVQPGLDDLSTGEVTWSRIEGSGMSPLSRLGWDESGSRALVERIAGGQAELLACEFVRFTCSAVARRSAAGSVPWAPRGLARGGLLWLPSDGSPSLALWDRVGRERRRLVDPAGRRLRPVVVREPAELLLAVAESPESGATRDELVRFSLTTGAMTRVATVDRATAHFHPDVLAWIEAESPAAGPARWRRYAMNDRRSEELVPLARETGGSNAKAPPAAN